MVPFYSPFSRAVILAMVCWMVCCCCGGWICCCCCCCWTCCCGFACCCNWCVTSAWCEIGIWYRVVVCTLLNKIKHKTNWLHLLCWWWVWIDLMTLTFRHFDDAERPVAEAPEVFVFYGPVEWSVRSMIVLFCWCLLAAGWLIVVAIWPPPAIVFAAIGLYLRKRCPAFCSSSAVVVAVEWSPVWWLLLSLFSVHREWLWSCLFGRWKPTGMLTPIVV